jgi:ankyrin repeat protein
MAAALLDAKAELDATDRRSGRTPLHYAAYEADRSIVALLIEAGANVRARDAAGMTPLMHAARNPAWIGRVSQGQRRAAGVEVVPDIVRRLIAAGAQADDVTGDGLTALHYAALEACPEAVRTLIAVGTSVNATTRVGLTPLHCVAGNGGRHPRGLETAEQLLRGGCNRDARTTHSGTLSRRKFRAGATPHDVAVAHRQREIAALLEGPTVPRAP